MIDSDVAMLYYYETKYINIMRSFVETRRLLISNKSKISKLDVQKSNKEYPNLKVARTNKFHDRFIVIDNEELYHCGA